jgi:hypothetical protein
MRRILLLGVLCLLFPAPAGAAPPLAEKYLLQGKTAEGERALAAQLKDNPDDDQARFGLGVVQFLSTFEHLGQSLYKYGLRTERGFGPQLVPALTDLMPQNPKSEKISYKKAREVLQTWLDDLAKAEATLAAIKDESVKLPLHVALIKLDLTGLGKPVNAAFLFQRTGQPLPRDAAENFVIGFDRGDVNWLRGYMHFLAGWGELLLCVDGQDLFEHTAHLFFEHVDSPYPFLQEEKRRFDDNFFNPALISDAIAFVHLTRLPVKEPARCKAALGHFEGMVVQAKEMWKHILAETDDDNEWIPNPRQTGVLGVKVTKEMIDTWLLTLDEVDLVLQGKRLLPFWRGNQADRGVNLRRVFTEPQTFDPFLWFQGTAAAPYLEKGPLTRFSRPELLNRLNGTFGGVGFVGFAFWFN